MLQTLEIANNDATTKSNTRKTLSETAVVTYFIARGFAQLSQTQNDTKKYRNIWHGYNVIYNYDVIRDNHELGIRINF